MKALRKSAQQHKKPKGHFLFLDISDVNHIQLIQEAEIASYPSKFLLIVENGAGVSEEIIDKLRHVFAEGMKLEDLIGLLRRLGVEESVTEAVRAEIENEGAFTVVPLGHDPNIDLEGEIAAVTVEGGIDRLIGTGAHAQRVLAERGDQAQSPLTKVARPGSWDEAVAAVPGLRKWVEAKREGLAQGKPLRDILIEHLRDRERGLGVWATSGADFPVGALRHFDQTLRHDLGNPAQWDFPEDIRIVPGPRGRPVGAVDSAPRERQSGRPYGAYGSRVPTPSDDEVREARRIVKRAERAAQRK